MPVVRDHARLVMRVAQCTTRYAGYRSTDKKEVSRTGAEEKDRNAHAGEEGNKKNRSDSKITKTAHQERAHGAATHR